MADTINIQDIVNEISAKARFQQLDADRTSVVDRARECAKLTIPSVVPDSGHSETQALETPYQAVGSRLVNNLASKLMLSLLPPNTSFFRLLPNPEVKEALKLEDEATGDTKASELDSKLMLLEQEMMKTIERQALRVPVFDTLKQLIIAGNGLLYKTDTGLKNYKLTNYVVTRDYKGNPVEIIAKETVTKHSIPMDIMEKLPAPEEIGDTTELTLYTRALRRNDEWYEWQEIEEVFVEGSDTTYKTIDELPFIPLRWTAINGENYGRGLVEQYLGDFRSLEGLRQLILEASAVMARVIFGKRPGGITDIDDLNGAENGQCITGDLESDISVLQVNKTNDLQVPVQLSQELIRSLEQSFLAASSATRDAERVDTIALYKLY